MANGERIERTGLHREAGKMYFIKQGAVWSTPMKKPGGPSPKGKAKRLASISTPIDYTKYLYYLDGDLNVMRSKRKGRGR